MPTDRLTYLRDLTNMMAEPFRGQFDAANPRPAFQPHEGPSLAMRAVTGLGDTLAKHNQPLDLDQPISAQLQARAGQFLNREIPDDAATVMPGIGDFADAYLGGRAFLKDPSVANAAIGGMSLLPFIPYAAAIKAWHGSPHDFDRFDISRIGTGEGNQSYGHGLYLAENPSVASYYRDMEMAGGIDWGTTLSSIKADSKIDDTVRGIMDANAEPMDQFASLQLMLEDRGVPFDAAEMIAYSIVNDATFKPGASVLDFVNVSFADDIAEASAPQRGRLYNVNIDAEPEEFLHWDKPLKEQSEAVQQAVKKAYKVPDRSKFKVGSPREFDPYPNAPADLKAKWLAKDKAAGIPARGGWTVEVETPTRGQVQIKGHSEEEALAEAEKFIDAELSYLDNMTGEDLLETMARRADVLKTERGMMIASEELKRAGLPGIRYLDGFSRRVGDGSHNYVVFRDDILDILSKE